MLLESSCKDEVNRFVQRGKLDLLITCYENLGYEDLKQETFTILEMNYPDFAEMEDYERKRTWLNRLSFGLLGTDEAPAPPISN